MTRNAVDATLRSPQNAGKPMHNKVSGYSHGSRTKAASFGQTAHTTSATPIDASRKYARRPRHKTRSNRYEYRIDQPNTETRRVAKANQKRRTAHMKTGTTLNQDFKAPNVESDRLTLKQGMMPGFFGKGKASEATDRRGLPDLTFSEMTFLRKKRRMDDARFRGLQALTSNIKSKGGAVDISGYFSDHDGIDQDKPLSIHQPEMPSEIGSNQARGLRGRPQKHHSEKEITHSGYGLSDAMPQAPPQRSAAPEHVDASQAQLILKLQDAANSDAVSWSPSPARRSTNDRARLTLAHDREPHVYGSSLAQPTQVAARTLHPGSSASNPTTIRLRDRAGESMLLPGLRRSEPSLRGKHYYSLDDLKGLARAGSRVEEAAEDVAFSGDRNGTRSNRYSDSREMRYYASPFRAAEVASRGNMPTVHYTFHRTAAPHPSLAQADPKLMPYEDLEHTERARFWNRFENGFDLQTTSLDEEHDINNPVEMEDGQPTWHGAQSAACTARQDAQGVRMWSNENMAPFDIALLASIQPPESNAEATLHCNTGHERLEERRSAGPELPELYPAYPQDIGQQWPDSQARTALLRPSQERRQASPPFCGFKRARLLY